MIRPAAPPRPGEAAPSLHERLFLRSAELAVPLSGFVEVTRRCNLACAHCYVEGAAVDMDRALFLAALAKMREAGTLFLTLSGGEPLVHPDLRAMIAAAAAQGFALALFTNATLIDAGWAAFLAETTVGEVSASVYSADSAVHDRITGVPGSHARTVAGLRRLAAAGIPVAAKAPVLSANAGGFASLAAFCAREGWSFKPDPVVTPKNSGDRAPLAHRASDRELAEALRHFPVEREAVSSPDALVCNAGVNYFGIDADGMLHPCIQMPMPLGRIDRVALARLWREHPALARLRALGPDRLTACRACRYAAYCDRCPGLALVESGDPAGPSESACRVAALRARGRERSEG